MDTTQNVISEFETILTENGFDNLIIAAIKEQNLTIPTNMQKVSLAPILAGQDVIVEAQTGSGKTLCFVLPLIKKVIANKNDKIQALVLSPTRELAIQTKNVFELYSKKLQNSINVMTVIGGERFVEQQEKLSAGIDIIVATPGRLIDLIEKQLVDLSNLKFLVLDEADKLLDQGFAEELDNLLNNMSSERQNLFFSATYPEKITDIVKRISKKDILHLKNDVDLVVEPNIHQRVILVNRENRGQLLRHLIKNESIKNGIVFVASQTQARNLTNKLTKQGIKAIAIYGDLTQNERNKALSDFKNKKYDFLIATDIAARGIDIEKLDFVINFDLPRSPLDYVHRIGRTGRAGEFGRAISFIGHEDRDHFKIIEKKSKLTLQFESIEGFELVGEAPVKTKGAAPVKGKRKSKKDKLREKQNLN